MVTKWMGDHYVLSFAPALRLPWSQILCRINKHHSDETINGGTPCVYCVYACNDVYKKRSHRHVKDPVVHVRVQWIMKWIMKVQK